MDGGLNLSYMDSVEARPSAVVYPASVGPGVPPSAPPHLERLGTEGENQ